MTRVFILYCLSLVVYLHFQLHYSAFLRIFMEYSNFKGKATRYEYWWFLLFMVLVLSIAYLIHERLYQIVTIIFLVPFLAVGTRRLNDAGQSAWWQLFLFVPFGQIIVLFYMAEKSKHIDDRQESNKSK